MIEANNKVCGVPQKAKLRGYLNQWLSYEYLACLQLYRQTLRQTAHLSYICQNATLLITDVISCLKLVSDELTEQLETDSKNDLPFPLEESVNDSVFINAKATNLPSNIRFKEKNELTAKQRAKADKCLTVMTEKYELKNVHRGKIAVQHIKAKLIPSIASNVSDRMKSFEEDIFTSFRIADHTQWDTVDKDYGVNDVKTIYHHFKTSLEFHNFSLDMALPEWRELKKLVK